MVPTPPQKVFKSFIDLGEKDDEEEEQDWREDEMREKRNYHFRDNRVRKAVRVVVMCDATLRQMMSWVVICSHMMSCVMSHGVMQWSCVMSHDVM